MSDSAGEIDQRAKSSNSVIRASSPQTTKRPVVHRCDEYGASILWTSCVDRHQAEADCRQEFKDDEVIGVPECPDCARSRDLRYYWKRGIWCCRNCGHVASAESPENLPQIAGDSDE